MTTTQINPEHLRARFAAWRERLAREFEAARLDPSYYPGSESQTCSPVDFECASQFTSLNEKEEEDEKPCLRCAGFGKRKRQRRKRERIRRLHSKESRKRASETKARKKSLRDADPEEQEEKAFQHYQRLVAEDGPLNERSRKISDTQSKGGSYNYGIERLQVSIAKYRKPANFKTKRRAYLLNAKPRQARSTFMRDWNESYSLFLASVGKPATGYLPPPVPVRSEAEATFEVFVHEQGLPVTISYPELENPSQCNDLFVGWDGRYYAGVRDYDLDIGGSKFQVQVKGIAHLYWKARDCIKEHWDYYRCRNYTQLRTEVFSLLLRSHQNRLFSQYADIEIRPMMLVSAASAFVWRRKSAKGRRHKRQSTFLNLLETESERVIGYLLEIAEAVFPAEYTVFVQAVDEIDSLVSANVGDEKVDLCMLLELYREVLAASKADLKYSSSFRSDLARFVGTYWHKVKERLPKRFTASRF